MIKHEVSWDHVLEISNQLRGSECIERPTSVIYGNDKGSLVVFVKSDDQWFEVREPNHVADQPAERIGEV
jgi:hypothetical protein